MRICAHIDIVGTFRSLADFKKKFPEAKIDSINSFCVQDMCRICGRPVYYNMNAVGFGRDAKHKRCYLDRKIPKERKVK